jgi:dTDP-4-amino-4,6-dideoxygalactose transaminase
VTLSSVPFLDLCAQFRSLEKEWLASIQDIGATGAFVLGPNVSEFEQEFAQYTGTSRAVALANGTDALVLSLRALNIGPGDEVITTPYTFFASAEAINMVGATPVFVDIEPVSFNLDLHRIEPAISSRTRAILPVHIFGHPAHMGMLQDLADSLDVKIIEDCAQAFGALHDGKRVGSFGATGTFSFYPTKVLGCYGDGGMVTTDDAELEQRLRKLQNHGAVAPFIHDEIGFNSRLDEIQASLLRIKLAAVGEAIAARQQVAAWYTERFAGTDAITPGNPPHGRHAFNLYTIRVPDRDRVRQRLADARIGFSVCYPQPLHLQPVYRSLNYKTGDLPQSELAARHCISLPIYPGMEPEQVDRVCEVVLS